VLCCAVLLSSFYSSLLLCSFPLFSTLLYCTALHRCIAAIAGPVLALVRMDAVVRLLRALNDAQGAAMLSTLVTIASNALSHGGGTDGSKFRSVKATSGLLTRSVLCVPGGDAALMLLGFEPRIVDKVKTFVVSECELCRRRCLHCRRVPGSLE
jgi:hypothetical protein